MITTRRHLLSLPAGAAALTISPAPDRLAGYTDGERGVITFCESNAGRRLTEREIAFQLSWASTVLGPRCEG